MLEFSINRNRQQKQGPARRSSAERKLDLGVDRRPAVRKGAGAFDFIFKEEITGVEVLHSQSERARFLNRYGALGVTEPQLRRWLSQWVRGGGLTLL